MDKESLLQTIRNAVEEVLDEMYGASLFDIEEAVHEGIKNATGNSYYVDIHG